MTAHAPIPSTPSLHARTRGNYSSCVFRQYMAEIWVVRNYWSMGTLLDALLTATPEEALRERRNVQYELLSQHRSARLQNR